MAKKQDFAAHYAALNITPAGVAIAEICRNGLPVRTPWSGAQTSSGGFASKKMGLTLGFESRTLERAYFRLVENDDDVFEFYEQAYQLRLKVIRKDGRACSYTHVPDLFMIRRDWIGFVEIKDTEKLKAKAEEQPNRFVQREDGTWYSPAAEEALAGTGLGYRVVTDRDINPILVRNLNFLGDFRRSA